MYSIKDAKPEGLARGLDQIYRNLEKKTKRRRMTQFVSEHNILNSM